VAQLDTKLERRLARMEARLERLTILGTLLALLKG
jgi:hypothetical protein